MTDWYDRRRKRERVLTLLTIGTLSWPAEALMVMWGCDLLEHEGFAVPTPGYLSCFVAALGLGLIFGAVNLERRLVEQHDNR